MARAIFDDLVQKGLAEWTTKDKKKLLIFWKPLEEWADAIYEWVRIADIVGSVTGCRGVNHRCRRKKAA